MKFATSCVQHYLNYAFPDSVKIAPQFASDLIEKEPTWKLADFLECFKWIRLNGKVMGNQMNPQKLMELVGEYNAVRAEEFEQFRTEQREQPKERVSKGIKHLSEEVKVFKGKSDQTFFEK